MTDEREPSEDRAPARENGYRPGDEEQVRRRRRTADTRDQALDETMRLVMSQPNGRSLMHWLLVECHMYRTCFSSNSLTMAKQEGERNIGLMVMARIQRACADDYTQMVKENSNA